MRLVYDVVNVSSTISKADGSFGFSHIEFHEDFEIFTREAKKEIERVQNSKDLFPLVAADNIIHFSSLPWVNFTSLSHARNFKFNDSVPKISFGKMMDSNGSKTMAISVHVHHALMDGFHVGQFIDKLQELMNN